MRKSPKGYVARHTGESVSILDHLILLIEERDRRYQERFEAQEKALLTAVKSIDYRLQLLNELRSGVATEDQLEALRVVVNELSSRVKASDAKSIGMKDGLGYLGYIFAAVTIVGSIITFVLSR